LKDESAGAFSGYQLKSEAQNPFFFLPPPLCELAFAAIFALSAEGRIPDFIPEDRIFVRVFLC
jgi:hypothetical protein